jgi:hypothetical protein
MKAGGHREKGKRGEREAAEILRRIFPKVRRRAMQSRGGHEGADLDNTPGLHVEVGFGNVNPRAKWEQAERDAFDAMRETETDVIAVAMTKRNRGEWLVTLSADAFMRLVELARKGAR